MDRIVYLSESSSTIGNKFYSQVLDYLKKNEYDKVLYILPNGELINHRRRSFLKDLPVSRKVNLYTFDDIAKQFSTGFSKVIDDELKFFIFKKIINDLKTKGRFKYYSKVLEKEGFIKSVIDIVSRIKSSLIAPDIFLQSIGKDLKFLEIAYIYREYNKYLLDNDLYDREQLYFDAISNIKTGKINLDLDSIYIDEFYDFRNIEWEIISLLSNLDVKIYINIPFIMSRDSENLNFTINNLKKLNFTFHKEVDIDNEFKKLGHNLFGNINNDKKIEARVKVVEAIDEHVEVKRIFQDIKRKLAMGVKITDICLNIIDEKYIKYINKVSKEEKLSISIDQEETLLEQKLSKDLLSLISIASKENFKNKLINRLNSEYFKINGIDSLEIYSYIKNLQFSSLEEFKEKLNDSRNFNLEKDILDRIFKFISTIELEINQLNSCNTMAEYSEYLLNNLRNYEVYNKILKLLNSDLESFKYNIKIYRSIKLILDGLKEGYFSKNILSIDDYLLLFKNYLKNTNITMFEGKEDAIKVLKLINNRGFTFKYNYILGLSQSNYPNIIDDNFIFNERNHKSLKNIGIEYNNYDEKLDRSILNIANVISSTENELILSYSSGYEGEIASSIIIDEIIYLTKNITNIYSSIDTLVGSDVETISSSEDYIKYKIINREDNSVNPNFLRLYKENIDDINEKISKLISRKQNNSIYNGCLSDTFVEKDMEEYLKNRSLSTSFLESYSRCKYNFLLERILNIKSVYEDFPEYDFLLMGTIYHNVLYKYYEYYQNEIKEYINNKQEFKINGTVDTLSKIIEEELLALDLSLDKNINNLLYSNIFNKLKSFIKYDIEHSYKEKLFPSQFEKEFRFNLKLEDRSLNLIGKIDRVDFTEEGNAVVIDYKTSKSNNLKDIRDGISLQIPIYLMAVRDNNPVAGVYGLINSSKYSTAMAQHKKSIFGNRRGPNVLESEDEWNQVLNETVKYIFELVESIKKANFEIDPKLCSDYCIYKDICRYREEVKLIGES